MAGLCCVVGFYRQIFTLPFEEFSKLETQMFERCEQVMGLVQVFVERNRIEARPPGVIKKVAGWTWKLGDGIAYWWSFFLPRLRDVSPKRTESVRKPNADRDK
jgi:hypothetical protein